jgi:phosphate/sulfate permease
MDIKLMPEEYQKKESFIGGLSFSRLKSFEAIVSIWVIVSIILIVAAVAAYLGLFFYRNNLTKEKDDLKAQIAQVDGQRDLKMEANFIHLEKGISDLKKALENRIHPSYLFKMVEELTLATVWFDSMNADFSKATLDLGVSADSYDTLAKQIVVLENDSRIKEVSFSDVKLEKEGGVNSSFIITLDPIFLRPTTTPAVK